jgi:hypothetical protein
MSLKSHASPVDAVMASQNDCEASIQAENRPRDSISTYNTCRDARTVEEVISIEEGSLTPVTVEEHISQTQNTPPEANDVTRSESRKSNEAAELESQDIAKAEFSKLHKLSALATSTFVIACLTVPCCVAFISFLWYNPDGTRHNKTWLNIVLNDWVLKSVTISTLVLRIAIGAQAG